MQLSEYIKENEKIFTDNPKVKYFTKLNTNSKYLLVIFSAFNGKEKEGMPAAYNYVKPLFDLEINQLYVLDSSSSGLPTYYLGEGNLEYEIKVIQLILEIAKAQNINISNIITAGTSKGGTAAAYFAMKYSLGAFISGGM
ncbi:hypothetical protein [Macrococcoides canis]|uniref:hypothetical protein n=1 Tax=Macrococcoides canis TaxID=1855823 RepID=UPI00106214CF|nr:hypothetical protein [Macrococcus canis]TDM34388.1 hypothetical protein ETI13_00985 [Macrococcus canis]